MQHYDLLYMPNWSTHFPAIGFADSASKTSKCDDFIVKLPTVQKYMNPRMYSTATHHFACLRWQHKVRESKEVSNKYSLIRRRKHFQVSSKMVVGHVADKTILALTAKKEKSGHFLSICITVFSINLQVHLEYSDQKYFI